MSRNRRRWIGVIVALIAVVVVVRWYINKGRPYTASAMSFDDSSDHLRQTVIVPTLDSPIPDGKSAIWCASFQLAWNRMRDDVTKGPIQLANAQPMADRLNRGDQTEDDIDPANLYAAAGLAKDGIIDRIRGEMAAKFPNAPSPHLDSPAGGAVAYSYLQASAKFDIPYFDNDEPFGFTDSSGNKTVVRSFGIREKDDYAFEQLRGQAKILYRSDDDDRHGTQVSEFIIDPCQTSRPYQLVLARVNRKDSFAATLADVETKIAKSPPKYHSTLNIIDTLLVPNMAWQISHHFTELEGRDQLLLNPGLRGLYLDTAMQTIRFRLDRSGAELSSESKTYYKPTATYFDFNRPFLIMMKKRDGKHPFFVMWVDNAELLQRKP